MKCPKCNNEVDEKDRVCPHCKRALLLECPICHKLNRTPVCDECGFVIVNKCNHCGKFNPTIIGKCQSCGFDTYYSVALNESDIEEYGCLVITFPNLPALKGVLKKKLYSNFYNSLKRYIFDFAKNNDIRASVVDELFVLKCYREITTFSSINKAVKSAIILMNKIAEVSYKLKLKRNFKLSCKMTILKRFIENEQKPFNTGLNIKLVDVENADDYMSGLQIITDQHVNNMISRQYKLEMIYSSQIGEDLVEFYNFPLAENIVPQYEEELKSKQNILTRPAIQPGMHMIKDDDVEEIPVDNSQMNIQTNCKFLAIEGVELASKLDENLLSHSIVALKYKEQLQIDSAEIFNIAENVDKKLLHVVCTKRFKYLPYAFFVNLIANYLGYDIKLGELSEQQKAELAKFDKENLIYKLLTFGKCNIAPKILKDKYISLFKDFLKSQKNTFLFIENFDLIDETSFEIFEKVFHDYSDYDLTILTTVPSTYLLHKEIAELMYMSEYKEITVIKSSVDKILSALPYDFSEVEDSYYLKKIKYQCCGGTMYFNQALKYLINSNMFINNNGKLILNSGKTSIIPSSLDQLIMKKFELLNENECYILAYAVFFGANIDIKLLEYLKIENLTDAIETLINQEFIYVSRNIINISNFNIIRDCIKAFMQDDIKLMLKNNFKEYLSKESYRILNKCGILADDISTIYDLCEYSIDKGDFNAYLRNSKRFLKHTYSISDDEMSENISDAREDIYSTLSKYIDMYPSDKIYTIANTILESYISKNDDIKIMKISKLMLDSAMLGENYNVAQQNLQRILLRLSNPAITKPTNSNLLRKFVYSCISVKLLFYVGNFRGCINALDNILDSISSNPSFLSRLRSNSKLKNIFSSHLVSVIIFGAISRLLLNVSDIEAFLLNVEELLDFEIQWKPLIFILEKLMHNEKCSIDENRVFYDVTSNIILGFLGAFKYFEKDYDLFAKIVYELKVFAKKQKESFVNLICDLLIGFSYQRRGVYEKSNRIFLDVLSISQKTGMKFVSVLAMLLLANLKYNLKEYGMALKLVENNMSAILNLDCDESFISILSGILYVNIMSSQNKMDDALTMYEKINNSCAKYNLEYLIKLMPNISAQ